MGWPFVWFSLFWPRKINERPRGSEIKLIAIISVIADFILKFKEQENPNTVGENNGGWLGR